MHQKKSNKKMKKKKRPKKLVRKYAALYYFAIFVVSLKVRIKSHKSFEVDAKIVISGIFTELAPLGQFSQRVAMSICLSVCRSVCLFVCLFRLWSQGAKCKPPGGKNRFFCIQSISIGIFKPSNSLNIILNCKS